MSSVSAFVFGKPEPQGSKTIGKFGGMYEQNAPRLKVWRELIGFEVSASMRRREERQLHGAVEVYLDFYFRRPNHHFRVKNGNPDRNRHSKKAPSQHEYKPDVDKLARAVLDALTGIAFDDDRQVVSLVAHKFWDDKKEGVYVLVVSPTEGSEEPELSDSRATQAA